MLSRSRTLDGECGDFALHDDDKGRIAMPTNPVIIQPNAEAVREQAEQKDAARSEGGCGCGGCGC